MIVTHGRAQNCTVGPQNGLACAEKLVLLGELLATASQYSTQCGDVMYCEYTFMLGLAELGCRRSAFAVWS
jgi:hypothetical protein